MSPNGSHNVVGQSAALMKRALALFIAAGASVPTLAATNVVLAPVVGLSVRNSVPSPVRPARFDLIDMVEPGYDGPYLFGVLFGAAFGAHDEVDVEGIFGPYHGELQPPCVQEPSCEQGDMSLRYAFHYGLLYKRSFGKSAWRPYLGAGVGAKTYALNGRESSSASSLTLTAVLGAERNVSFPVRLEGRFVHVSHNDRFFQETQVEIQIRVAVSLFKRR